MSDSLYHINDVLTQLFHEHAAEVDDDTLNHLTHSLSELLGLAPMGEHNGLLLADPITAPAATHPCQLHLYHAPRVVRCQGHHRQPIYLQNRVYGKIQNSEIMWLCGTCHDSVHAWLSFLLGEAKKPEPEPGTKVKLEAERTYNWYVEHTK